MLDSSESCKKLLSMTEMKHLTLVIPKVDNVIQKIIRYPVNSIIQPLNNWGLMFKVYKWVS